MKDRNKKASWEMTLAAFEGLPPDRLTEGQRGDVAIAIYDACQEFPLRDQKLSRYREDVASELFLLVYEQYDRYDPARGVAEEGQDGSLVRYIRMLMGHKLHEVRAKMYHDLGLDGAMGMTDLAAVTDEQGRVLHDEVTGKTLVRAKYSRKDTPGQVIDGFSLNETLDDDGAEKETLVADTADALSERLEQEEACDELWNIVLAVIGDFEGYTSATAKKKGQFYGLCYTERMSWCAMGGGSEFQTAAAKKYEPYILHGLNRDYLGYFSTTAEKDALTLEGLCRLTMRPVNALVPDADSEAPVGFSREGWLPAKVPQNYLLLRTGNAPVASEVKRRRDSFLQEFQKKRMER